MFASKEEILASIQNDDVAIVDGLPFVSFEASHISDSICLPYMDLMQRDFKQGFDYLLPNDALALRLRQLAKYEASSHTLAAGSCGSECRSPLTTGHDNVAVYDGSLQINTAISGI
jgi:hypothetical protein